MDKTITADDPLRLNEIENMPRTNAARAAHNRPIRPDDIELPPTQPIEIVFDVPLPRETL